LAWHGTLTFKEKSMDILKLSVVGISGLLMHNNQAANPLNNYSKALKRLSSKRNKTDDDHRELARLEWEAGLYLDGGRVVIPARCIEAAMWAGAKKTKNGVKFKSGVLVEEDYMPLAYDGPLIVGGGNGDIPNTTLDKFFDKFNHQALVKVGQQTILRTRPLFQNWSFKVSLVHDPTVIDERTLISIGEDTGRLVGLLDNRPRFGRFMVEKV
jgi:hypothetical protein